MWREPEGPDSARSEQESSILSTPLGFYAERVVEASCLAALVVAPLFISADSVRLFEPGKNALVRTLATLMLGAWLVGSLDGLVLRRQRYATAGQRPFVSSLRTLLTRAVRTNPLALPVALLFAATLVSTLASISPAVSLLGGYERGQGLLTLAAYFILFFLAANALRSLVQVERMVTVLLMASVPVALYGIVQHYTLDPVTWPAPHAVTSRAASTLGGPTFLAGYLVLTFPLALGRLVTGSGRAAAGAHRRRDRIIIHGAAFGSCLLLVLAWGLSFELGTRRLLGSELGSGVTPQILSSAQSDFFRALGFSLVVLGGWWVAGWRRGRASAFLLTGCYAVVLALQTVCFLFTQSRGPFLGLMAGAVTFVLLQALVRRKWRLAVSALLAAGGLFVFLLLFVPAYAPGLTGGVRLIERLGPALLAEGGSDRVRVLIWEGTLRLILPHAPLSTPFGSDGPTSSLRWLIGYGPESLETIFSQVYPPELGVIAGRASRPDHAHNELLHTWVQTGIVGAIAYLWLMLALCSHGLRQLGLIAGKHGGTALTLSSLAGGALFAVAAAVLLDWRLVGVAAPAGITAGLLCHVIATGVTRARKQGGSEAIRFSRQDALVIMLLAAVVGHFVETQVGIAGGATRTTFWILAAALVATAGYPRSVSEAASAHSTPHGRLTEAPHPGRPEASQVSSPPLETLPSLGVLAGLALITLAWSFISAGQMARISDANTGVLDAVVGVLTLTETVDGPHATAVLPVVLVATFLLALALTAGNWAADRRLRFADWLRAVAGFTGVALLMTVSAVVPHTLLVVLGSYGSAEALSSTVLLLMVFLVVLVLTVAGTLGERPLRMASSWAGTRFFLPAVISAAAMLIYGVNVAPLQADMLHRQALMAEDPGRSLALAQRIVALQPLPDYPLSIMSRVYLSAGEVATDGSTREHAFAQAEALLQRARALNPLNPDHVAGLAHVHQLRARYGADTATRKADLERAIAYSAQATRLSPHTSYAHIRHAQAWLDYAAWLVEQDLTTPMGYARDEAARLLDYALALDPSFCLTHAVRAHAQQAWQAKTRDALLAIEYLPRCRSATEPFAREARALIAEALTAAAGEADATGESEVFLALLERQTRTSPTSDAYLALAAAYARMGATTAAVRAAEMAVMLAPATSGADFRNQRATWTTIRIPSATE